MSIIRYLEGPDAPTREQQDAALDTASKVAAKLAAGSQGTPEYEALLRARINEQLATRPDAILTIMQDEIRKTIASRLVDGESDPDPWKRRPGP